MEYLTWFLVRAVEQALAACSSWSNVAAALQKVGGVLTDLESGMAWPYLVASLLFAGGMFVAANRQADIAGQTFGKFLFPRSVYLHPSAKLDYRYYVVNLLLKFFLYVPIIVGMGLLGYKVMTAVVVERLLWEPPTTLSPVALLGLSFGFFLLHDFVNYVAHVLFHKIPALWAFHQLHHAAEVLTPITAYRVHPMEVFVPALLQAPVIGLASVCVQNLTPRDMEFTTIFGIGLFTFLFGLLGHHLQHSHIKLSFGPVLNRIYISPVQHQIHHSTTRRHRNKNFGVKFAVWDVLFGTLYVPGAKEDLRYGLSEPLQPGFNTVVSCYWLPFVRAAKALAGSSPRMFRKRQAVRIHT